MRRLPLVTPKFFWFRLWNTRREPALETVDEETAARLRAHYADDVRRLEAMTGIDTPWPVT